MADRIREAKKALFKVANLQIMDEKHRKLEQIDDSVKFLSKICGNVYNQPTEERYRKVQGMIKLTNPTFSRHVRDAPGAEAFMKEAGWHIKVEDFERYWVFTAQPGSVEWDILQEAVKELDKLAVLVAEKIRRATSDRKAEVQQRLDSVRAALEEDRLDRQVRFQQQQHAQADVQQQQQRAASPRRASQQHLAAAAAMQRTGSSPLPGDQPDSKT